MKEPIFNNPVQYSDPLPYVLYWIAAIIFGCFGVVNRSWVDKDDKWWETEQHYWDHEYEDPKQHWDGYEYRALLTDWNAIN
jgi:hypothetical protein